MPVSPDGRGFGSDPPARLTPARNAIFVAAFMAQGSGARFCGSRMSAAA